MVVERRQSGRGSEAVAELAASVAAAQNLDGSWGYHKGSSWTEPTVLALLSLLGQDRHKPAFDKGVDWLVKHQREDGGWPPAPTIEVSTWVTALVLLLFSRLQLKCDGAVTWILRQSGRESSLSFRLKQWMLGLRSDYQDQPDGWPWFPGAAAWVIPSALTVVALAVASSNRPDPEVKRRIEDGRRFLFSRMCRDGGWNHGSSRALGYESDSYPETTGLVLLALRGESRRLRSSISRAQSHLLACRSAQASSWLRLGLLAHGQQPVTETEPACRDLMDACLVLIARRTAAGVAVL